MAWDTWHPGAFLQEAWQVLGPQQEPGRRMLARMLAEVPPGTFADGEPWIRAYYKRVQTILLKWAHGEISVGPYDRDPFPTPRNLFDNRLKPISVMESLVRGRYLQHVYARLWEFGEDVLRWDMQGRGRGTVGDLFTNEIRKVFPIPMSAHYGFGQWPLAKMAPNEPPRLLVTAGGYWMVRQPRKDLWHATDPAGFQRLDPAAQVVIDQLMDQGHPAVLAFSGFGGCSCP